MKSTTQSVARRKHRQERLAAIASGGPAGAGHEPTLYSIQEAALQELHVAMLALRSEDAETFREEVEAVLVRVTEKMDLVLDGLTRNIPTLRVLK